jgi:hypothetical protein
MPFDELITLFIYDPRLCDSKFEAAFPDAVLLGLAELRGRRIGFTKSGLGSFSAPEGSLEGLLWCLSSRELDLFEREMCDCTKSVRSEVAVRTCRGLEVQAEAHFRPTLWRLTLRSASYFDCSLARRNGGSIGLSRRAVYTRSPAATTRPRRRSSLCLRSIARSQLSRTTANKLPRMTKLSASARRSRRSRRHPAARRRLGAAVAWAFQEPPRGEKTLRFKSRAGNQFYLPFAAYRLGLSSPSPSG